MLQNRIYSALIACHPDNRKPSETRQNIPLKRVSVEATIQSFGADVTIQQVFCNDENTPIEAVYCFPIEERAAVYSFVARIDDREIVATLKEKAEAQKEYSQALRQGHGAYLLEQNEQSQDNFIINVGALPPGKECHIQISYVTELELVQNSNKIRFVIPTTIAPRYNPTTGRTSSPASTTSKYVQSTPYTIQFRCLVEKMGVARVSSLSHPIQIDLGQNDVYVIEFAKENTHLDRDIIVDIDLLENRSNIILAVEPGAVMAAITPSDEDYRRLTNSTDSINEFIFVVDCSGSMQSENKIGLARQALLLFLKSLPAKCQFNIVRFGSNYESLFPTLTSVYNEETAKTAEQYSKNMKADLGGTELLQPLQWLHKNRAEQGRARQIFLLTDGEISNVEQVLDLCRSMSTSTRIFSFGLGHSPSRSLVKGLARATKGRFVFIPPGQPVDIYVGEQLQKALESCITNIQVKWNVNTAVMHAPKIVPPVYIHDRLIVYALAEDSAARFDCNCSVQLSTEQNQLGEAKLDRIPNVASNGTIARLAAKALILELQHEKLSKIDNVGSLQSRFQQSHELPENENKSEITKKRIIELSLKYGILCPHTAFVGIEKRTDASNSNMVLREVPIEISADDTHLQSPYPFNSISNACRRPSIATSSPICDVDLQQNICEVTQLLRRQVELQLSCQGAEQLMRQNLDELSCKDADELSCNGTQLFKCSYVQHSSYRTSRSRGNVALSSMLSALWPSSLLKRMSAQKKQSKGETIDARSPRLPTSNICQSISEPIDATPQNAISTTMWPTSDQDIVRLLINKQRFDGFWELDSELVENLTGKPMSSFRPIDMPQIFVSALIVLIMETRFASLSTLWYGVIKKAKQSLLKYFGDDSERLESLFDHIRQQL